MTGRSHYKENHKKQPVSPTPATGMFQPRPFAVQPQTEEQSEQPDIKTALQRAERYGHHLDRIKSIKPPVPAPIPQIVQAKLTIGQPGDRYEQQADRVAAQVVNQIHAPTAQRQEMPEEDELQMKPEIGSIQRQELPEEDEELQMKPEAGTTQRQELPEEDEELQMQPTLQLQPNGSEMTAQPDLEASIQQARGSGQPLADSIKEPMEQAMGADFGGVKVHADAQSDQLNQSIQARAFTTGQDVFFRSGEYNPGSRGGQELIAHELTHVVQQSGGTVRRSRMPLEKGTSHQADSTLGAPISVSDTTSIPDVQRTKWRWDGSTWNNIGGSSNDTDPCPLPSQGNNVGDEFDQQTGDYTYADINDAMETVATSKERTREDEETSKNQSAELDQLGYQADDEMSEESDYTILNFGKGRGQVISFKVPGQHESLERGAKGKKQYIMDKAIKAPPRSFREDRVGQTLRHISTRLFAQFGGEEIQCAYFEKVLYISSNRNSINKKLEAALKDEKAKDEKAKNLLMGGQNFLSTKRQKRHGRKLRKGLKKGLENRRGGKMPPEIIQAITENNVVVTPKVKPDGLHAERRINKYINELQAKGKGAVNAADYPGKGVKRPCAVCYHKLFQGDNRSAGPLWSSKAATIGTSVDEVTPEMKLTTVTTAKDGTLTIDYDTESDSDSDSSEVESPRKKETGSAVSKKRTAAQEIEQGGRKRRRSDRKDDIKEQEFLSSLLETNNCLINAIARPILGRNANVAELVSIRTALVERGFAIGAMLVASPRILEIIRQTFRTNRGIIVYYQGQEPDQIDGPSPIEIDHANAHFQEREISDN